MKCDIFYGSSPVNCHTRHREGSIVRNYPELCSAPAIPRITTSARHMLFIGYEPII